VLYGMAAFGGGVASFYFSPVNTLSVGASGAIFGLMTATIVVGRSLGIDTSQITLLLVINVLIGFSGGIDWRAHFGGAVVGAVVASQLDERRPRWVVIGGVLAALVAMALVRSTHIPLF
jgi:membrane associated rhomboid family serine protease